MRKRSRDLVLLLPIVVLVARATRAALKQDDVASLGRFGAPARRSLEPATAAAIALQASEHDRGGVRVEEPSVPTVVVPALANGNTPLADAAPTVANGDASSALANAGARPAPETIAITLWRGYTKAQFIARLGPTGAGSAIASSKPFRWRAGRAQQSEAVIRAHDQLLARLAESGWRIDEQVDSDEWYGLVLNRGLRSSRGS
jgi:hypothetical protein